MSKEEKVCVKVLMNTINYAAKEIAKFDYDYKDKLKGLNELIAWKVGDNISFYTEIKDGDINGSEGTASINPTITFEISDVEVALKIFTGKQDILELGDKVKISGDIKKIEGLNYILDTVKEYIGDLTK